MDDDNTYYAKVGWSIDDVLDLKPDWSEERCEEFLLNNQNRIRDLITQKGYEIIETLVEMEE